MTKASGKTVNAKPRQRARSKRSSTGASSGNAVFLVGFMGAGKSSVGRVLGQRLNWVFEDLDDRIEAREGRTVAEIFRDSGESEFRRVEHAALRQVLEELQSGVARIVALGGGTFAQPENHKVIQDSGIRAAFLDAPLPELWRRCAEQKGLDAQRPLQCSENHFRELYEKRLPFYKTAKRFETEGKSVETVATEIAATLRLNQIAVRTEQGEVE